MYGTGAIAVYNVAGPLGIGINQAVNEIAEKNGLTSGPPFWIGVDADQDWMNPSFCIASCIKRVDRGVYYSTELVKDGKFREVVESGDGIMTLGMGTTVAGIPMEGISMSTLDDLDEFIKMGEEAEKLTGKSVLPMPPDEIRSAAKDLRDAQPSWIWDAVEELETKIRSGEVTVPLAMTEDVVTHWRGILG
jgi:basic membrane protein A